MLKFLRKNFNLDGVLLCDAPVWPEMHLLHIFVAYNHRPQAKNANDLGSGEIQSNFHEH